MNTLTLIVGSYAVGCILVGSPLYQIVRKSAPEKPIANPIAVAAVVHLLWPIFFVVVMFNLSLDPYSRLHFADKIKQLIHYLENRWPGKD